MTESKNNHCPLAIVDQRLCDCLNLWIETKNHYFDPDKFRLSLNNTIQAFRNITFILQKIGFNFKGFSEWYQKWQEIMQFPEGGPHL